MKSKARVFCLDLEGVLVPEIWIAVAEATGIPELRLTTRDVPDYDALMRRRLKILKAHRIKLSQIQKIIDGLKPLPGAEDFLGRLRETGQVIILSDTYYEFATPLMRKLGFPTLFCNWLLTDRQGFVSGYRLRQPNGKKKAVAALRKIGFEVIASGDSYNDLTMLEAAHRGVLFNPPDSIRRSHGHFPVARSHAELYKLLTRS